MKVEAGKFQWSNMAVGALVGMFEVSTLGHPFEVIKTNMAANRGDPVHVVLKKIWKRGGVAGFYQGLVPWGWVEAATKTGVLMFAQSEIHQWMSRLGLSQGWASAIGGMGGGVVQAFTTMGFTTFMKTVEMTREKETGPKKSTWQVAADIIRKDGILAMNQGVTAVALRQMTNWGSRFGFSRTLEKMLQGPSGVSSTPRRFVASITGGMLATWNQPIEVIRVEMQKFDAKEQAKKKQKKSIGSAASAIYKQSGIKGFYRGISPRILLGAWQTVCTVFLGDSVKSFASKLINH
jgi:hypothetical protein